MKLFLTNTLRVVSVDNRTFQVALDPKGRVWLCTLERMRLVPHFGPVSGHTKCVAGNSTNDPYISAAKSYFSKQGVAA